MPKNLTCVLRDSSNLRGSENNLYPFDITTQKPANRHLGTFTLIGWKGVLLGLVTLLQLSIPYPIDDDTAYHFSVGQLIREHGILHSFPWTRFSWQFDHYADKEFLFHLLFVPFVNLGFVVASRTVGIICGTSSFPADTSSGTRFSPSPKSSTTFQKSI